MKNTVLAGFRGPYCTYSLPAEQVQAFSAIRRAQALCALTDVRIEFARVTVREKLKATIKMMKLLKWNAPILHQHVRKALEETDAAEKVDLLMGIEGAVSRRIYEEWALRLPPEFAFSGRNRRPPLDPVNAYISYCNSILYSLCVPPLAKAGLNTAVGFLHEPGARRHSLSLDMAEGIKPVLSEYTLGLMIKKKYFSPDMAETTSSGCFLNLQGRKVARYAMKNAMYDLFGQSDHDRLGWPDSFWEGMKDYAETLVKCVVRGKASPAWKHLR